MVQKPRQRAMSARAKAKISQIENGPSTVFTRFVGKVEVGPWQQSRLSLGVFSAEEPPKGFSINITPDPAFSDTVGARIIAHDHDGQHELMLHIANRSENKSQIEVWQM